MGVTVVVMLRRGIKEGCAVVIKIPFDGGDDE
jgi:hypothetical protein